MEIGRFGFPRRGLCGPVLRLLRGEEREFVSAGIRFFPLLSSRPIEMGRFGLPTRDGVRGLPMRGVR